MSNNTKTMTIFGDLDEEYTKEVMETLYAIKLANDEETEEEKVQVQILISTYGGSILELFAIYDIMREIQAGDYEVHTHGLGKVMSAGVLLLAAGTKGKRKIGKNCRVMMHYVVAGCEGSYVSLQNEMDEIKYLQEQYKKCLVEETNISMRSLNKYLKSGKNIYLSAEQAVELGIADEIV